MHAQFRRHMSQMSGAKGESIVGIEPLRDPEASDGHGKPVDERGGPLAPSERGEYYAARGVVEDGQQVGLLHVPADADFWTVQEVGYPHLAECIIGEGVGFLYDGRTGWFSFEALELGQSVERAARRANGVPRAILDQDVEQALGGGVRIRTRNEINLSAIAFGTRLLPLSRRGRSSNFLIPPFL